MKPDFSKIRSHTIDGRRYEIIWKGSKHFTGYIDDSRSPYKRLNIKVDKDSMETLLTTAHEILHGTCPNLSEEAVCQFERDFARLLKRMGVKIEFHPK